MAIRGTRAAASFQAAATQWVMLARTHCPSNYPNSSTPPLEGTSGPLRNTSNPIAPMLFSQRLTALASVALLTGSWPLAIAQKIDLLGRCMTVQGDK